MLKAELIPLARNRSSTRTRPIAVLNGTLYTLTKSAVWSSQLGSGDALSVVPQSRLSIPADGLQPRALVAINGTLFILSRRGLIVAIVAPTKNQSLLDDTHFALDGRLRWQFLAATAKWIVCVTANLSDEQVQCFAYVDRSTGLCTYDCDSSIVRCNGIAILRGVLYALTCNGCEVWQKTMPSSDCNKAARWERVCSVPTQNSLHNLGTDGNVLLASRYRDIAASYDGAVWDILQVGCLRTAATCSNLPRPAPFASFAFSDGRVLIQTPDRFDRRIAVLPTRLAESYGLHLRAAVLPHSSAASALKLWYWSRTSEAAFRRGLYNYDDRWLDAVRTNLNPRLPTELIDCVLSFVNLASLFLPRSLSC